jgi:hypothetical protein
MPTRLDRERRSPRAAGRNDKTSIDLLEHVRGGVQVESLVERRFRKDSNMDSREWSTPESAADTNVNPAYVRRRSRLGRRSRS